MDPPASSRDRRISHHSNGQRVTASARPHGPALAVPGARATLVLTAFALLKSHGKEEEGVDRSAWLFQSTQALLTPSLPNWQLLVVPQPLLLMQVPSLGNFRFYVGSSQDLLFHAQRTAVEAEVLSPQLCPEELLLLPSCVSRVMIDLWSKVTRNTC